MRIFLFTSYLVIGTILPWLLLRKYIPDYKPWDVNIIIMLLWPVVVIVDLADIVYHSFIKRKEPNGHQ